MISEVVGGAKDACVYNISSKTTQSQPSNFITSSPCSILLWTHADDAMKAVKCISVMGLEKLKFDKIMSMS